MSDVSIADRIDRMFVDSSRTYSIEGNELEKGNVKDSKTGKDLGRELGGELLTASQWLPFASEVYRISPNLKDYAFVPIEIIRSELPNKNGIGFTFEELARFHPEHGQQAYKTWIGKGCYAEHENNRQPDLAKGVILDVALRRATEFKGNFYRLNHFLAYDRNKDTALVNKILHKERIGYSMGSLCQFYSCSICGQNVNDLGGMCDHIDVRTARSRAMSMRIMSDNKLAYARPHWITGIECSSVGVPAASYAKNDRVFG